MTQQLSKSQRIFIRREKMRIRKDILDIGEQNKQITALYEKLGVSILKSKEKKFFSTSTLFLISASAVIYYFPLHIAIISIVYFLIGDTIAEIYGSYYRKYLLGRKSLEGSFFGFIFCGGLLGYLFYIFRQNGKRISKG